MNKSDNGAKPPSTASSVVTKAQCSTSSCHFNIHSRKTLEFNVRGPACVYISEEDQIIVPGLSILEITFPEASEVGEITVRNYYTAWLSVYVKYVSVHTHVDFATDTQGQREDISGWILSIPSRILMPNPHLEHGSHDLVSLVATDSMIEWKKILAIRMYLHQPSPIWRTYYVGEINVYKDLPRLGSKASKQVPARKTKDGKSDTGNSEKDGNKKSPGPPVANRIIHILKRQTMHSIQWKPSETNSANIFQMPSSAPSYSSNSFAYEVVKLPSV